MLVEPGCSPSLGRLALSTLNLELTIEVYLALEIRLFCLKLALVHVNAATNLIDSQGLLPFRFERYETVGDVAGHLVECLVDDFNNCPVDESLFALDRGCGIQNQTSYVLSLYFLFPPGCFDIDESERAD